MHSEMDTSSAYYAPFKWVKQLEEQLCGAGGLGIAEKKKGG